MEVKGPLPRYLITMILGMGLASSVAFSQQDTCGWAIGVEGRFAQTWDHGLFDVMQSETENCSLCPSIDNIQGTTWTTGVTIGYLFQVHSTTIEHGPFFLAQLLGRALTGSVAGDRIPALDENGNVIFLETEHQISTATQHLAASIGYTAAWAGLRIDASLGVAQMIIGSGEELFRWPDGVNIPVDPPPDWEVAEDGRSFIIERFDSDDMNRTQVIAQISVTYALTFDQLSVSVGPYYGHTFSSTLVRASGPNRSIDDLGGVLSLQYTP